MYDAKKTLRFFHEHFDDIKTIYKRNKKKGTLDFSDVEAVFSNSTVIDNLVEYRIIEERFDGDYTFNESYGDFISFLLDDFSLDMPEQIKKYYSSLSELFDKLKIASQKNLILEITNALEDEIRRFEKQLQLNISKLISETKYIKANNEKLEYVEKLKKASELTSIYVEPLNTILDEHSDSIYSIVTDVLVKSNLERFNHTDKNIRQSYQRLYTIYSLIRTEISNKNRLLIDEVIPLLDRIQNESRILTGFINFLSNHRQHEVPTLLDKQRNNTYSIYAELEVKDIWNGHLDIEEEIIFDDIEIIESTWIYDKDKYYTLLLKSLPNDDFYTWIYTILEEELGEVSMRHFFDISKLIFENNIHVSYLNQKIEIELSDKIVIVPIVQIRK